MLVPCAFVAFGTGLPNAQSLLLYICSALVGWSWGCGGALFPPLTRDFFGDLYYGTACGLVMIGVPLGIFASNLVYGEFYDIELRASRPAGSTQIVCYGSACFKQAFLISTGIQVAPVIFATLLFVSRMQQKRRQAAAADATGSGIMHLSTILHQPVNLIEQSSNSKMASRKASEASGIGAAVPERRMTSPPVRKVSTVSSADTSSVLTTARSPTIRGASVNAPAASPTKAPAPAAAASPTKAQAPAAAASPTKAPALAAASSPTKAQAPAAAVSPASPTVGPAAARRASVVAPKSILNARGFPKPSAARRGSKQEF
jgi:hypothetical protein